MNSSGVLRVRGLGYDGEDSGGGVRGLTAVAWCSSSKGVAKGFSCLGIWRGRGSWVSSVEHETVVAIMVCACLLGFSRRLMFALFRKDLVSQGLESFKMAFECGIVIWMRLERKYAVILVYLKRGE